MLEALFGCNQVSGVLISSDSKGGYLTPNNATRELAAAAKDAGIRKLSPHELRHTFISLMENEIEAPRSVVEELAGKAKDSRNGVYSKAPIEQKRRWMELLWDQTSTSLTTSLTTKQA